MDVLILGGFLGSGKTTILLNIIEYLKARSAKDTPVAILENEIGSVGIDDQVLSNKGYAVTNMLSGCACCTLSGDLPIAVESIRLSINPDLLIIESTGLAVPESMKDNISAILSIISRICILVDASRWRRIRTPLSVLLGQQLRVADLICINKIDLVDTDEIQFIKDDIRHINDRAPFIELSAIDSVPDECIRMIVGE